MASIPARECAVWARHYYRVSTVVSDDDLDRIVRDLQLRVREFEMEGQLVELLYKNTIALKQGLSRKWRRWLIAHALGHRLLHPCNQLALYLLSEAARVLISRQERQAEIFAGWLLLGGLTDLHWRQDRVVTIWELAELAEVEPECVERWWCLVGQDVHLRDACTLQFQFGT